MKDLGDHLCPAVDKIYPSILHMQVFSLCLCLCLFFKEKAASVIDLPDQALLGKGTGIRERGTGCVLAKSCGVDNKRMWFQMRQGFIITCRGWIEDKLKFSVRLNPIQYFFACSSLGRLRLAMMILPGRLSLNLSCVK